MAGAVDLLDRGLRFLNLFTKIRIASSLIGRMFLFQGEEINKSWNASARMTDVIQVGRQIVVCVRLLD